ncbi:HAMP domain-containing sensor histidine kinase [Sphingomonas sp.]|jgi:signal transduction histidine kinase|uniref:PAS domain-containing sensor histidine kinase n=1 Tax=Sphingomonas sp. TaxID=28214 RepID=UPI002E370D29|nr:HAMP domain-containing sensor histidine kinase [Sphingomonas sp.]HEX4694023.1 HAMP domain-containing sensor histidine kinase [Sphingomonas sp.]
MSGPVAHGLVDRDGRLVEAERPLDELNTRAGGALGQPFAVPQVAVLARLAQRLGIPVSRHVVAADGPDEIELWVRADPVEQGVRLAISGWRVRAPWTPPADTARRDRDLLVLDADWSWETDATLRLTAIGEGAVRFGIDAKKLLGKPLDALMTPKPDDNGAMPMFAVLLAHGPFDDQPATVRASGATMMLSARPRLDTAGNFAGYVGAARAVSAPAAPIGGDDALTEAFGARLDRALRAPLGRIIANADSINAQTDGPIRQDYADYAADIASAGRHLMTLVDDLVDLQAIERPDFVVAAEPVDLADVGRRAAGLLNVRAAERGVRIDKPQDIDTAPAIGEFKRVLQILVNLIGNAVRYSPDGGMVWVRTHRDRDTAVIIVADQGKGIAKQEHSRIFEKFERVDPTEPGGSGLGLYIARRLARAMGGDLTVDSAPGEGARFMLTLPAQIA